MLPKFFIDRPIFAWVIALIILLSGGLALHNLPVASYPAVAPPALSITLNYPGASAQVVEETAVSLVEQELNGVEHLLYMDSSSEQGIGTITLTFEAGTNLDVASVETQNRIKRAEARLPDDVRRVGITVAKSARNFLMIVALVSPDKSRDNVALGSYAAANILENIRRVPGVGEALLFGTEYSMRLWLKPEKLHAYNLSPGDVSTAVRAQNTQLATGELGQLPAQPGQQLNAIIVTRSRLSTPEEFGNIIVRANPDGSTVRVKDVARVELGAQDYSVMARIDGQPASAMAIRLSPTANALDTAKAVKAKMDELSKFFPKGVDWIIPYDTSKFVEISISEVVQTLIEAMVLVFIVIWLFLGNLRATFIPAIVVPIALIGGMVGLYAVGYSVNTLTLFAMVLAVGIVVDDAIVVVENVERIMTEENLSPRDATRKAMGQIVGAIIAITLVLCAVFVPMMFFGGSVGAIYRQFAVTLVLTILFSLLMAMTLTPALCAALLRNDPQHEMVPSKGFLGWFNRFFGKTTKYYRNGVERVLRHTGRYLADLRRAAGGLGLAVHAPAHQLPAGRRPGLLHQRDPVAAGRHARTHPGGDRQRRTVLHEAARGGTCHRRVGLLLLRPRTECRHGVRAPQGLGRAPQRGQRRAGAGEESQHGPVPHQAGVHLRHQRAADPGTGGGGRLRLPFAGPFRPGTRQAAGSAQYCAGRRQQAPDAGRRAS